MLNPALNIHPQTYRTRDWDTNSDSPDQYKNILMQTLKSTSLPLVSLSVGSAFVEGDVIQHEHWVGRCAVNPVKRTPLSREELISVDLQLQISRIESFPFFKKKMSFS